MFLVVNEKMIVMCQCGSLQEVEAQVLKLLVEEGFLFADDAPVTEEDYILFRHYQKDVPNGLPDNYPYLRLAIYVMKDAKVNDTRWSVVQIA